MAGSFVVSGGQLVALDRPVAPGALSVRVTETQTLTYEAIYRSQPHVRTVISFLARNIAQIGVHVFERVSDTDRKRLTDHPMATLLARPNPRTTRYRLIDALINDLGIYDNAFWVKAKGEESGRPHALFRIPPSLVTPLGASWLAADAFRVKGANGVRDIPADQVVHFRGYNPSDARWGLSPMETLRQVLAEEYEAGQWRTQLWRNGARFPGHIRRPIEAAQWSDGARERFVASWKGLYTGDGPGAGGTPILEDGMEFHANGVTPQQAQYLETRKLTREEVAAAFHIPLPMVGILDHATFSNIQEQHRQLYQDTLGPWLQMITEEIGLQLLPDLDPTGQVYVEFNMAEKLRGDFAAEAAALQGAVGGPTMTPNEARARQNLPAVEGGDSLYQPLNLGVPGGASDEMAADELASRIASAATLIRSGFDPVAALVAVGLDPVKHLGLLPVTVQKPVDEGNVDEALVDEIVKSRTAPLVKAAVNEGEQRLAKALREFVKRQQRGVMGALGSKAAAEWWDGAKWDTELAALLYAEAMRVTAKIGQAAALSLGFTPDDYDVERTSAFLMAVAKSRAEMINEATRAQVEKALAEPAEGDAAGLAAAAAVFAVAAAGRASQQAKTLTTTWQTFATVEAGRHVAPGKATKTWRTRSAKPRKEHARLDGQTVGIDEPFSNGAEWPGDPRLGASGVANCECTVEITIP